MDAGYSLCVGLTRALAEAGDRLASTAQIVSGWKGVEAATHRISIGADGPSPSISLSLEVRTQDEAFWMWVVEIRCDAEGWAVHDRRQGLGRRGEERATDMPTHRGATLDGLVERIGEVVTHVVRNVQGGWWLRAQPKRTNR